MASPLSGDKLRLLSNLLRISERAAAKRDTSPRKRGRLLVDALGSADHGSRTFKRDGYGAKQLPVCCNGHHDTAVARYIRDSGSQGRLMASKRSKHALN